MNIKKRREASKMIGRTSVDQQQEEEYTIENVDSEEEVASTADQYIIGTVDSDQDLDSDKMAGNVVEIEEYVDREHISFMMEHITLWIAKYLKHIGDDLGMFPRGTKDIVRAFERWSVKHCIMTGSQTTWYLTRNIFIGSSQAFSLFKHPVSTLRTCPPYNVAAGFAPHQLPQQRPFSTDFTRLGIAMEDAIRESQVAIFSRPLITAKPGRVVSTHGVIGMSCTGDIELLNPNGEVACLMEVKTLCKGSVKPGLSLPDTIKKAREAVREILANNQQFTNYNPRRGNIFSQQKRFIRLDFLEQYGHVQAPAQLKKFALHTHVGADVFLKCCTPKEDQRVDLYFYEPDDCDGQPAQAFSMSMIELGLTINPFSPTAFQMLCQQCVYQTSHSKIISKEGAGIHAWMNLLLVVPYEMDSAQPRPYMIMKMPVFFSDRLCAQIYRFYADHVYQYVSQTGLVQLTRHHDISPRCRPPYTTSN